MEINYDELMDYLKSDAANDFQKALNDHQRLAACYYWADFTLRGTSERDFRKLMGDAKTEWKLKDDELTLVAKAVIESVLYPRYPRYSVSYLLDVYYDARLKDANGIKEMDINGVKNVPPSLTKDVISEFFLREVK